MPERHRGWFATWMMDAREIVCFRQCLSKQLGVRRQAGRPARLEFTPPHHMDEKLWRNRESSPHVFESFTTHTLPHTAARLKHRDSGDIYVYIFITWLLSCSLLSNQLPYSLPILFFSLNSSVLAAQYSSYYHQNTFSWVIIILVINTLIEMKVSEEMKGEELTAKNI